MQTAAGGPIKRQKDGYKYIPDKESKGGWQRITDDAMSDVFTTYVIKGKDKRADVRIDKKSENFDRKFKYDETEIPFIKDKEITLTNAGLYTGAKLSTNLLDSIAKYAKISGLPLKTAVGLVAKETSLGNPTVDSSLKKLAGDDFAYQLAKALNGGQHINEGKALNPKDLINFHYEEQNPYLGLKNIAYKKSVGNIGDYGREGPFGDEDFLKRYREQLKLGENYSDNQAKKLLSNFNPNKNVLQAGFEFYKQNPRKYNYNQTNYPQLVEERGNMVYNSPEFKSWLSTSEYKKQGGKMNILEFLKNGSGIHIKEKNKGKFTSYCGGKVTNECIQKGKNSSNPAIRKRATFAANARKWKHKEGGKIDFLSLGGGFSNILKNVGSWAQDNKSLINGVGGALVSGIDLFKNSSASADFRDSDNKRIQEGYNAIVNDLGDGIDEEVNSLIAQMKEQNPDQNFGEINYQMLRQKVEQQRRQKNMQKADMYKQYELEKQGKVLSSMEESNTSLLGGLLSKLGGIGTDVLNSKSTSATKGTATGSTIGATSSYNNGNTTTYTGTNGSLRLNNMLA